MRLVKLSTAAAVAAGLATSASAVELTEAIKGVDVSGYVRYRMEAFGHDENNDVENADNNTHKYKYRVKATIPVNDQLSTILNVGNQGGEDALDEDGYGNSQVGLLHAYFQYTGVENLTVQAGKQPIPAPFADDEHGNGLVAMYNAGPVTVAGAVFDSSNARGEFNKGLADDLGEDVTTVEAVGEDDGDNIMAVGAIGSVAMVNMSAWYAVHQNMFEAYTLAADADVVDSDDMNVNVGARYSALDPKDDLEDTLEDVIGNSDTHSLWQIHADATMNMFDAHLSYAQSDEDGGYVGYTTDAATNYQLENLSMYGVNDADAYKIGAGVTYGKLRASLDYMDMEYDTATANDVDADELLPAVAYQMSDNFNVRLFHSIREDDNVDMDETQLELKYTF